MYDTAAAWFSLAAWLVHTRHNQVLDVYCIHTLKVDENCDSQKMFKFASLHQRFVQARGWLCVQVQVIATIGILSVFVIVRGPFFHVRSNI